MTTNRNPVKQFFITFPHSTVDKSQFRDNLLRFDPDYYKIAEEEHKDGTPHLHAVIRTKNKFSKAFVLKYFKEIYPDDYKRIDVETVRSIKNALKYLSKEDTSPLESGEFIDARKPQENFRTAFARECGYPSVDAMLSVTKLEQERLRIFKQKLHERHLEYLNFQDFCLTYELQRILTKILSDYYVSKDDITKIANHYNIKY